MGGWRRSSPACRGAPLMSTASDRQTERGRAVAWARSGAWSVLDQALFAGANFLVNVLLARWLSPEAYGAFAVAFVVFLLVGAVHGGLFIEPMLVFGAGRFEGRTAAYLRVLFRAHVVFSLVTGALLVAIGGLTWWWGEQAVWAEFLALGVGSGFILALWLLRRACYVVERPAWAAGAGALYLVLLLTSAFALSAAERLNGAVAIGLMAAGAFAASLVLAVRLGLYATDARPSATLAAEARAAHVGYGRWAAPTGALEWVHSSLPMLVLPAVVGLEGSGALRALYNLAMPALQAFSALSILALPLFVRARVEGHLRSAALRVGGGLVALGAVYGLVILAFGKPVVAWLYNGKYPLSMAALVCLAVLPAAAAASGVLMALLRSAERPKAVFHARVAATSVAATAGVAVTALLGVVGALVSDLLALATEIGVQGRALRQSAAHRVFAPRRDGRLRVLMNAYACYPGAGSEPGVGWNVAREMARHHEVWVVTYAGWRKRIEAELAERPIMGLHVVYAALPFEPAAHVVEGQARSGVSEQLHYLFWQVAAARRARQLHRAVGFDLAHHVTHVKYWAPSAVRRLGIPYVWGPVGGGESTPAPFYDALGEAGRHYEERRDAARRLGERLPSVRATARGAALAFATTEATAERMRALGARGVEVRSAIGLAGDEIERLAEIEPPFGGPIRFLGIGRQEAWKGYAFAIQAFAEAVRSGDAALDEAELWLVGDGPEHDQLRAAAEAEGVADRVRLFGQVPRAEVSEMLGAAHALVQPSLHDSGGGVCLEAMAAGRPVVGFDLGGTPVQVGDTGLLVPAETPARAVSALAHALRQLAADAGLRQRLGTAARARAATFNWADRVAELAERYREVVGLPAPSGDSLPGGVLDVQPALRA